MIKILVFFILLASIHAYSDISVDSLSSTEGITLITQTSSALFGSSVSNIGDFNGDGYDDVVISSYGASEVYVIFGSKNSLSDLDVNSELTASKGVVISGATTGDLFGYSVSAAGDVNDDGIDDIIIGAQGYGSQKGAAYIIYGSKTPPAAIALSGGLALTQGFAITGASIGDFLGGSVSYAGDVNNDKIDDVIIGAHGALSFRGAAYVIFGKKGTRNHMDMSVALTPSDGFVILGAASSDLFGRSVSNAGDIDGDGIRDLVIGSLGKGAYVLYGKNGAFDLSSGLTTSQGFRIAGASYSDIFSFSVSFAGDFNGDGRDDVLIGAIGENSMEGAAYVIFGKTGRSSLLNIDLSSGLAPSRGIRIAGATGISAVLGYSISGAGDINNDGIDDIIIGAPQGGTPGTAHVVFGSKNLPSQIVPSNGLAPHEGFSIVGHQTGDNLGVAVSYAGDVNGDEIPDVIVGATGVSSANGAAYLLFSPLVCPERCVTCKTGKKCLTCKTGYELVNGNCVPQGDSSLGTATGIAKGMFNSGSVASRIFTMGRSLSVSLGLIAKIIQNVRFLDINYSEEALTAFKTYGTDLFELPIPETLYISPDTKELPGQYARYDMEPSFLENYWDTVMMILITLGCFLLIKLAQLLTKSQGKESLLQVSLKNMGQTAANFFFVQIYSNLDDVIFYLLLDIQSTKLGSSSAGISLGAAILFLIIGLSLVFFHCWLLSKYQQAKSQGNLERFEERYGIFGTLCEDFKDNSIASHSFFGILILRCVILILVIMLLQPQWMQGTLLMITNLAFLGYFIYYRPFKSRFDEICQYFCEFTVFAAYLPVLILSIMDTEEVEKLSLRNGLGKCIVIAGIVLALGGFVIQMIQVIGAIIGIYKFFKNHSKKELRVEKLEHSTSNSAILQHTGSVHVSDQLEFFSRSPHRRISPEMVRQNDREISSFHLEEENNLPIRTGLPMRINHQMNTDLPRRADYQVNLPYREEMGYQQVTAAGGQPKLGVSLRPMGSRIHQERSPSNSPGMPAQVNHHQHGVRRKKIRRNKVRPDLIGLGDGSIRK